MKRMNDIRQFVVFCSGVLASVIGLLSQGADAAANTRVALVIGNSDYAVSPLQNPSGDTDAIAKALGEIGFDTVLVKKNLGAAGMKEALKDFSRAAAGSDIAIVFYAGHGMEMAGKNYLIPVDARLDRASDIDLEAISLDTVLGQLDGVHTLKLVILDACRNSAFRVAGGTRGVTRGLGRIEPEDNTLVAYAARAGTTAEDGTGNQHSPFTQALLKHIETPGLDVRLLLGRVRDDVVATTGGAQTPHVYGTLGGQAIYLLPPPAGAVVAVPVPTPAKPPQQEAMLAPQSPAAETTPGIEAPNEPLPADVPIDPEVLRQVETNPFFANAPPVQAGSFDLNSTSNFIVNGTRTTSTSNDATVIRWLRTGIISSNVTQQAATVHRSCRPGSCTTSNRTTSLTAANGLISLGYRSSGASKVSGVSPTTWTSTSKLVHLENLQGRVFPLDIGNRFSYKEIHQEISQNDNDEVTYENSCEITKKYDAKAFHSGLAGLAYLKVCNVQTKHKSNPIYDLISEPRELFFESLGIWISADSVSPRQVIVQDRTPISGFSDMKSFTTLKSFTLRR